MRILEVAITVMMVGVGAGMAVMDFPSTQCDPEEVCYPIDPNPPKPAPPNCFVDEEGGLTCYPVDPSGKF